MNLTSHRFFIIRTDYLVSLPTRSILSRQLWANLTPKWFKSIYYWQSALNLMELSFRWCLVWEVLMESPSDGWMRRIIAGFREIRPAWIPAFTGNRLRANNLLDMTFILTFSKRIRSFLYIRSFLLDMDWFDWLIVVKPKTIGSIVYYYFRYIFVSPFKDKAGRRVVVYRPGRYKTLSYNHQLFYEYASFSLLIYFLYYLCKYIYVLTRV